MTIPSRGIRRAPPDHPRINHVKSAIRITITKKSNRIQVRIPKDNSNSVSFIIPSSPIPGSRAMAKRKRESAEDVARQDVEAKVVHAKKLLSKAMKQARRFEIQKMPKRLRMAESEGGNKKERLELESRALNRIDVEHVSDAHLYKTLLKTKTIAASNLLPEFVVLAKKDAALTEEQIQAQDNVTARMFNTKPVKDCMAEVMGMMYAAVGASTPSKVLKIEKVVKQERKKTVDGDSDLESAPREKLPSSILKKTENDAKRGLELEWEGFDSGSEADTELDEDDLARYNARIVGSSDEDSEDEDQDHSFDPRQASSNPTKLKTLNPRDLSVTPEPTPSRSPSPSPTRSLDQPPETQKPTKQSKPKSAPPPATKASAFLPTLMGGYWSGTDSSASDDEGTSPAAPPPRKNRRGQQARRAIAEKKFKEQARHIREGKEAADTTGWRKREMREAEQRGLEGKGGGGGGRDDGWDAKRGATGGDSGRRGFKRSREQVTGENAAPLGERKKAKHRDDKGVLHGSWAAARAAKEAKSNAKFEGKKITFD